jgi:hypothetical protein
MIKMDILEAIFASIINQEKHESYTILSANGDNIYNRSQDEYSFNFRNNEF